MLSTETRITELQKDQITDLWYVLNWINKKTPGSFIIRNRWLKKKTGCNDQELNQAIDYLISHGNILQDNLYYPGKGNHDYYRTIYPPIFHRAK